MVLPLLPERRIYSTRHSRLPAGPLMNKRLHKWRAGLGSGYPSASSPYWRALPMRRMTKLLMGAFFSASGAGFAVDLLQLNHPRLGHGFFWPIFGGAMAAGVSAARIKNFRLALPLWLVMVVLALLTYRAVSASTTFPLPRGMHQRVVFDAIGIWLGT